jgi:hypothetical protein
VKVLVDTSVWSLSFGVDSLFEMSLSPMNLSAGSSITASS